MSRNIPALNAAKTKICVFDSPATFAREAWQDGKLLYKVDAAVLLDFNFRGGKWFPFILNVGPWSEGTVYGDEEAIGK